MVLSATKIIDGRDHLLGRLASIVAKELLSGQSIVIVRCDEVAISGSCELIMIFCSDWFWERRNLEYFR
jgi:ribosomal protein L13